jgi:hypothetical protein
LRFGRGDQIVGVGIAGGVAEEVCIVGHGFVVLCCALWCFMVRDFRLSTGAGVSCSSQRAALLVHEGS